MRSFFCGRGRRAGSVSGSSGREGPSETTTHRILRRVVDEHGDRLLGLGRRAALALGRRLGRHGRASARRRRQAAVLARRRRHRTQDVVRRLQHGRERLALVRRVVRLPRRRRARPGRRLVRVRVRVVPVRRRRRRLLLRRADEGVAARAASKRRDRGRGRVRLVVRRRGGIARRVGAHVRVERRRERADARRVREGVRLGG